MFIKDSENTSYLHPHNRFKSILLSKKWLQDCNSSQIIYHFTNLGTTLNNYKK